MQKTDPRYSAYAAILKKHLRPAMGCTEPIAIAYAAAVARKALGCLPEKAQVWTSGNIIKNAMAVTVPNTDGRKGIDAACAAGLVAGNPDRELQVIADVTEAKVLSNVPSLTYAYYFDHVKPKPKPAALNEQKGWVCKICGYVYEGEELPADYVCPLCKHGPEDFEKL